MVSNLPQATSRYTGAFQYSVPPAPDSFQLVQGLPAQSMGRLTTYTKATTRRMKPTVRPPKMRANMYGLAGPLDTITDAAKAVLDPISAKTEKLENAIKVIMVLSAVAAGTGVLNLFKR